MNIYQKLVEVRKAVPYLKKDKSGAGFSYVSSSDTIGSLKEKMNEMGLLLVPSVTNSEIRDHTNKSGGHQYFTAIEINFQWINADDPKETIVCEWIGQGLDTGEKGVGKALTYAEKYFLLKFFNIPTDSDDPDSFKEKHSTPAVISEEQVIKIKDFLDDERCSEADLLKWAGVEKVEYIPASKFNLAIAGLERRCS